MTCGTGPFCHHSPDCQDHDCPGRGQDASDAPPTWLLLPVPVLLVLIVILLAIVGPTLDGPTELDAMRDVAADLHELTTPQDAL